MASQKRDREIRISKDKHLIKLACVPLDALSFPFSRDLDTENVERLRGYFSGGRCFSEKEEYHIPAIIRKEDYEKGTLHQRGSEKPLFDPPPGMKLRCLRGKHRVKAAEGLRSKPERWLVAMYNADISENATKDLMEGYDSAKRPSDGDFYYNIKYYGRHDSMLAQWWTARLRAHPQSKNSGDYMAQLRNHASYDNAIDNLHHIDALYSGFTFGSLKRLWGLGCPDELRENSLGQLKKFYETVFEGDVSAMQKFDTLSLSLIQGTAPGACEEHEETLKGHVSTGKVFSAFNEQMRRRYFDNICKATRRVQVPSLHILFKNLTYFETLRNCMTRLLIPSGKKEGENDDGRKTSSWNEDDKAIRDAFANAFVYQDGQCLIQIDDCTLVRVRVEDKYTAFDIAYRQLWLFAIRKQAEMPAHPRPRKVGPSEDPANKAVLYEFALLAQKLGFMNSTIRALLDPSRHPDRAAVKHMLESTRRGCRYPDMEKSISACLDQVNSAVHAPVDIETDGCDVEGSHKVALWGRPWNEHAKADRQLFYLPMVHETGEHRKDRLISSYFVARSQYLSWFGEDLGVELNITDDLPRVPLRDTIPTSSTSERSGASAEVDGRSGHAREDEDRIRALRDEESRIRELLEALKAQKSSTEQSVNDLGKKQEELEHRNKRLADIRDGVQEDVKNLEENIARLEGKRSVLEKALADKEIELSARSDLHKKQEELEHRNNRLEDIRDGVQEDVKNLEENIARLEGKRSVLEAALADKDIELSALEDIRDFVQEDVKNLVENIARLEGERSVLEAALADKEIELSALSDLHARPQPVDASTVPDDADIFPDDSDDNADKGEIKRLQSENEQLKGKNERLVRENEGLRNEKLQLGGENNELQEGNGRLENRNNELKEENDKLNQKNNDLEEENNDLDKENDGLDERNKNLEEVNNGLAKLINELEQEIECLKREIAQWKPKGGFLPTVSEAAATRLHSTETNSQRGNGSIKIVFYAPGSAPVSKLLIGAFSTKDDTESFAAYLQRNNNRLYVLDGDGTPCEVPAPACFNAAMVTETMEILVLPDKQGISNMPSQWRHSPGTFFDMVAKRARRKRRSEWRQQLAEKKRADKVAEKKRADRAASSSSVSDENEELAPSGRVEIASEEMRRRRMRRRRRAANPRPVKRRKERHQGPGPSEDQPSEEEEL